MTDHLISRARILIQQNRLKEAEDILQEAANIDTNNPFLFQLKAEIELERENAKQALELIDKALSLAPNFAYFHYFKSRILLEDDKYDDAERTIEEAINIDANEAEYYAYWAFIKIERKNFKEALELADKALELDGESLMGLNARSAALLKLDRIEESAESIEGALKDDPDNAFTHSNYGWNLLEQGKHKEALIHFQEALNQDPTNEYAKSGMATAIKANNIIYRYFLMYSFWISNLTSRYQWGFIIGYYIVYRILNNISENNPSLQPILIPIIILLAVVAFSTWIISPISNLFLRLSSYGNLLLKPYEKKNANFAGIFALVAIVGILLYLFTLNLLWLPLAIFGIGMMIPMSALFSPVTNRLIVSAAILALTIFGVTALYITYTESVLFNQYTVYFIWGLFGFQLMLNYYLIREDNK